MNHFFAACAALFLTASSMAWAQSSPDLPSQPSAPKQADIPKNPESPPSPEAAHAKLWPADTVPLFVLACAQFHKELVGPCKCTISNLMATMPHDEFLKLSAENRMADNQKYLNIRRKCIGTPNNRR